MFFPQMFSRELPADASWSPEAESFYPLTHTYEYAANELGFSDAHELAQVLLYQPTEMPVPDGTGLGFRNVTWLPANHYGSGAFGPRARPEVMVIGKMPGTEEIQQKRNFVGRSGELLRKVAEDVGLNVNDWHCTNTVRFLPADGGKSLKPFHVRDCMSLLAQEISLSRPKTILLTGADAVKAVFGKHATLSKVRSCVFGMPGVAGLGHMPLEMQRLPADFDGIMVLATIHPAAVLREAGYLNGFIKDLELFRTVLGGQTDFKEVDPDMAVLDTAEDVEALVELILSEGYSKIAVDCEWGGKSYLDGVLRSIQLCWRPDETAVIVFTRAGNVPAQDGPGTIRIKEALRYLFGHPHIKLIGHNMRADAKWLGDQVANVIEKTCFDTMLADHILNENAEHGLDACAIRFAGKGRYDRALTRWMDEVGSEEISKNGFLNVPDDILHPYGANDVDATLKLATVMESMLAHPGNHPVSRCFYEIVMPCMMPIHEIETTGIVADRERMEMLVNKYAAKRDELLDKIRTELTHIFGGNAAVVADFELGGSEDDAVCEISPEQVERAKASSAALAAFNPRSYLQMEKLLFAKPPEGFGLTPLKTTEKPARMWVDLDRLSEEEMRFISPSTDAESMEFIASQTDEPVVKLIQDFKIIDQMIKMFLRLPEEVDGRLEYVDGLIGKIDLDGRIRTTISQMSETGRWKSSNPNCFDPEVELLTSHGWISVCEIYEGRHNPVAVAQMDVNTGEITFELPLEYQRVETTVMVRVFTDKQIDLVMTPDHRCLVYTREMEPCFVSAGNYPEDHKQLNAGRYVGGNVSMPESQIALICALQADVHVTKWGSYDFGFKKARKIERLEWALKSQGIHFKRYAGKTRTRFYIFREDIPDWFKLVPPWYPGNRQFGSWLLSLDRESLSMFSREVWFWGGCYRLQSMFASKDRINVDWVQIVSILSGRRAKIRKYTYGENLVLWQVDATDQRFSMTTNRTIESIRMPDGYAAYCVTMSKGTVIARYNGRVHITGQCQNIPKKQDKHMKRIMGKDTPTIRSCFTVPKGHVMIEADYKSAEIFTLGYLSNCMKLVEDAKSDLHARGVVTRLGAPKWDGFDEGLPPDDLWKDTYKALRVASKTISFGIPYQRGAKAIAREIVKSTEGKMECDTQRAQLFIDGFYEQYPEVRDYVEMCKRAVTSPGYLENPFGRRRRAYVNAQTDEKLKAGLEREFVNFPIQATVADALNRAVFNLWGYRRLYPGQTQYKILLAIHDAVLIEAPGSELEVLTENIIPRCMVEEARVPSWACTGSQSFSLDIDIEVGTRWGESCTAAELSGAGVPDYLVDKFTLKKGDVPWVTKKM